MHGHAERQRRERSDEAGACPQSEHRVVQAKLRVGPADDPAEREADRVAAQVVRQLRFDASDTAAASGEDDAHAGTATRVRRMVRPDPGRGSIEAADHPPASAATRIRRITREDTGSGSIGLGGGELDPGTSAAIERARGGGTRLQPRVQASMERSFGTDFSAVRIHEGSQSDRLNRQLNAKAFTTGSDVFFSSGSYQPDSPSGQHLLAHELSHVVQQGGRVQRSPVVQRFTDQERAGVLQGRYKQRAEEFEFKLGYGLSKDPRALEGSKALTDKFKQLLIARHGAGKESDAYQPGLTAHGRVEKARIAEVFDSGNLRERMGTLYAAITNYEDKNFGLGAMLGEAAKSSEPQKYATLVDTKVLGDEASAKQRMFGRKGKTGDESVNDRIRAGTDKFTKEESNKQMQSFFASKDAPTPNKVIARGEAPLTTREFEGSFPKDTKKIRDADPTWSTLDEPTRASKYLAVLGDRPLKNWAGGENYNKLGPKLIQEGTSKNMRMLAGFSGTTDMYLHAGQYFKLGKPILEKIRLAALGTMLPARDHSFHEVMVASQEYGLDYTEGPVGYSSFRPLKPKEIRELAGVPIFPHELLGPTAEGMFDAKTADDAQERMPTLPKSSALPGVGWKAKLSTGKSSYELVLKALDDYHAAVAAKQKTRFTLADALVAAIDAWLVKNQGRGHSRDSKKLNALTDLRGKALLCGSHGIANATEQGLMAKASTERLTSTDDEDPGMLALSPELAQGLTEEGVIALERLLERCVKLSDLNDAADPSKLPVAGASAVYNQLLASADGQALVAAIGDNAGLMLRIYVEGYGAQKVCKPTADKAPDKVAFTQLMEALGLVGANFAGVKIRLDGVGPREGDTHKVGGGDATQKLRALGEAYKLSPLELDCVIGYTTLEYKAFVDGTAKPERTAALNSALRKLPRYNGPLYRGDYSYTNAGAKAAQKFAVGTRKKVGFTSTGKSLADSFIPKRPTAHVYLSNRSGGDIEALSKKTWEQEVLFPENVTFEVVAVVDKRSKQDKATKKHTGKGALQDDGHITGKYGMPSTKEQQNAGIGTGVDLVIKDPQMKDAKWTEHYTENFSNKVWVFWKEV